MRIEEMYHKRTKRLVEVCPQCCKSVDSAANRLVQEKCGHSKCRICLLQETSGCFQCAAVKGPLEPESRASAHLPETQQRKSVITSLAIQIAEQKQLDEVKSSQNDGAIDKETCTLFQQSLEKDILFPTEIVKRSTGNFYHLKRIFSQRFFNEDNKKMHKACETEEKWTDNKDGEGQENSEEAGDNIPSHIEIQYYCKIHKVFFQHKRNILRYHESCTSGEKPSTEVKSESRFKCRFCDRTYTVLGKLNRHMKMHTKNSKFKCKSCSKVCYDSYALRAHERTHTQQKPYVCQICDKRFSGLQNFKRHQKKHKDEKKFVCDDCGFRFITKSELKRHSVTHTNIKSFECASCSKTFAMKRTLVRHMRTHDDNLVRLECQYCESTFKRKDNLERHIKNAHLDQKIDVKDE